MVGKAGLIYVIGFALILGIAGKNLSRYAVQTAGNMSAYCDGTLSHNLASAGANIALAKFYHNRAWSGTFTQDVTLKGLRGTIRATLTKSGSTASLISASSYSAWWAPGGTLTDTIIVSFWVNDSSNFAQYAWFTGFNGNDQFWYGGDTVWGPVRSNGGLHMGSGTMVFDGKVLLAKNITGPGSPVYKQGSPAKTVGVSFPANLASVSTAAASGGKTYTGDLAVTFNPGPTTGNDGSIILRNASTSALVDSFLTNTSGFNGAIWVTGSVYMKGGGRVDGRLTIGATENIYIMGGGLRYEQDPLLGSSDDILGLCATKSIIIGKNSSAVDSDNWPNCRIDAALFALQGSFTANTPGGTGILTVVGTVCEGSKGDVMGSNGKDGYLKRYHWDSRFGQSGSRPLYFPGFGPKTYKITNWWESPRVHAYLD
jgi:hypothetical protein